MEAVSSGMLALERIRKSIEEEGNGLRDLSQYPVLKEAMRGPQITSPDETEDLKAKALSLDDQVFEMFKRQEGRLKQYITPEKLALVLPELPFTTCFENRKYVWDNIDHDLGHEEVYSSGKLTIDEKYNLEIKISKPLRKEVLIRYDTGTEELSIGYIEKKREQTRAGKLMGSIIMAGAVAAAAIGGYCSYRFSSIMFTELLPTYTNMVATAIGGVASLIGAGAILGKAMERIEQNYFIIAERETEVIDENIGLKGVYADSQEYSVEIFRQIEKIPEHIEAELKKHIEDKKGARRSLKAHYKKTIEQRSSLLESMRKIQGISS